jgi:hypothetical protein
MWMDMAMVWIGAVALASCGGALCKMLERRPEALLVNSREASANLREGNR